MIDLYKLLSATLLIFIWLGSSSAQWKTLNQSPLGLSYDVPRNWYVGGMMDERKCNCESGTLNSSMQNPINMVIFAGKSSNLDSLKMLSLQGYSFMETPVPEELVETKHFQFQRSVSRWNEDETLQVIRLHGAKNGRHYLIYFWGEPQAIENQADNINRIIQSIKLPQNYETLRKE